MTDVTMLLRYLRHQLRAKSWRRIHSPFLFQIFEDFRPSHFRRGNYSTIEAYRKELLSNPIEISITDLGAGSRVTKGHRRTIAQIARLSAKSPKQAAFQAHLAVELMAGLVIELGTSLGISAMYLAMAQIKSKVITVEGDPTLAGIASDGMQRLGIKNVQILNEDFDTFLKENYNLFEKAALVIIDGNHTGEAIKRYYDLLFPVMPEGSCLVLEDIYWSESMEKGWNEIVDDNHHKISVDLFYSGWLFKRSGQRKEHFTLRF